MKQLHLFFASCLVVLQLSAQSLSPEFRMNCSHANLFEETTSEAASLNYNSRSDSLDILNYSITLNITDFTNKIIAGNCDISFKAKVAGVNYMHLDLLKFTLDSIRFNGIKLTTFTYNDTLIRINFPTVLTVGANQNVIVYYRGTPQTDVAGFGGFYFQSGYALNLGVGFSVDPHVFGRAWFPCFDNFIERSTYDFNITVPTGKRAQCNGTLQSHVVNGNGTDTYIWDFNYQIPTYLASVAVADYTTYNTTFTGINGAIPVQIAALPADTTAMKNSFTHLDEAFAAYESRFGPYLWDRVGYALMPMSAGAMEHATNIAYPRAFCNGALTYETIMAHELSHHWWGDLVTCETDNDMWINEGIATYCEHLFSENVYGSNAYQTAVKANLTSVLRFNHIREGQYRAIYGLPHEYTYGYHTYQKGALVTHNLRSYLGDVNFFNGMKTFLNNHPYGRVNSTMLRDELAATTGISLTDFFNDWVFGVGYPHFSIVTTNASNAGGGNYNVSVEVLQKLTGTSTYFKNVPLEIAFYKSDWTKNVQSFIMDGSTSTFNFSIPFNPILVVLNPNQKINDAISSEAKVLKTLTSNNFANAFATINVTAITDSAYVRVEHNWTEPDKPTGNIPYRLSPNHYWKIDGILPANFVATITFGYDGRQITSPTYGGFFDHELINVVEDSIVLLYRVNPQSNWEEHSNYTKTMANVIDKVGSIRANVFNKGEYVLAIRDYNQLFNSVKNIQNQYSIADVYPNPTNNSINVKIHNIDKNGVCIEFVDQSGKIAYSRDLSSSEFVDNKITISTEFFKAGVYHVTIRSIDSIVTSKSIVITH